MVEFYAVFAAVPLLVMFAGVWFIARRLDNYSVVDPAWALGLLWPILVLAISCWERAHAPRVALFGTMGALWSLRLGLYLVFRVAKHHPDEDVRYKVLRERWKGDLGGKFFWFFEAQGLLVAMLGVPFAISFANPARELGWIEWLGFAVWLAGFVGESVADAQMRRFKSDSANRGKVCQVGLWRYSRHPNYFFESVIWWGFWLFACGSPWGWVTIYAPLLILHFLLRVTGIPLTEKCAVESKGEAYREYQRSTSAFVPWRPKPQSSLR
jgi:steroid 5-alpha reductase family enzyme